jgi:hypothetical protein
MKRIISIIFLFAYTYQFSGCYSLKEVTRAEFEKHNSNYETLLLTNDNKELNYNKVTYSIVSDTLYLTTKILSNTDDDYFTLQDVKIPMDNIRTIKVADYSSSSPVGVTIGTVILGAVIVYAAIEISKHGSFTSDFRFFK